MDILFFGGMNLQREAILTAVNATGLAVHVLAGSTSRFGEDLDRMLARAKIVLNLHYYHGIMVQPFLRSLLQTSMATAPAGAQRC